MPVPLDRVCQHLSRHALDWLFAGRIDICNEEHVGVVKRARKLLHLVLGARVAMGLEEDDDSATRRRNFGRSERRLNLRRMMSVVVDYEHTGFFTFELKAPVSVRKLGECFGNL